MNRRAVLLLPSIVNIHMQMKLKYTEICNTSKYVLNSKIKLQNCIYNENYWKLFALYSVAFYLQGHVTIYPLKTTNQIILKFEAQHFRGLRGDLQMSTYVINYSLFMSNMTKTCFNQIDLEDFIENQQKTRSISQSVPINTRIK